MSELLAFLSPSGQTLINAALRKGFVQQRISNSNRVTVKFKLDNKASPYNKWLPTSLQIDELNQWTVRGGSMVSLVCHQCAF